mgnify:CR=1 FL=1
MARHDSRVTSKFNLRSLVRDARTFVFPMECAGCGRPDVRVCSVCVEVVRARPQLVPFAGADWSALLPVISCGEYDETFARMIHAFKDAGRTGLARDFAPRLLEGVSEFLEREAGLTSGADAAPVRFVAPPSTRANRRTRGFEPLTLIARHARITLWQPLESARRREDQAALGVSARADNMRYSLRARGDLGGASVIVIDDLMTTGSTLTEMTRALIEAGAHVRGAVVLAHAERRWPQARLDDRRAPTTGSRHARL